MEHFDIKIDPNNIIHLKLENLTSERLDELKMWAEKVGKTVLDVYNRTGEKVRAIVDVTDVKKYDSESFLILAELLKNNARYIFKTATFGGDDYILAAQDALLAFSGRTNFKAFRTKGEALDWLILDSKNKR